MMGMVEKARNRIATEGLAAFAGRIGGRVVRMPVMYTRMYLGGDARFTMGEVEYPYLVHKYNEAWRNERSVEVPIALSYAPRGKRVLEVGNVLNNYAPFPHDVVDKYEVAKGVINEDVVDYDPPHRYDLIISVSTLEHVGFDEKPRDPKKILHAISNLRRLLTPNGLLVFTVPLGYNTYLDDLVATEREGFKDVRFLARVSEENDWSEVEFDAVRNARYGYPFNNANAIAVCEVGCK